MVRWILAILMTSALPACVSAPSDVLTKRNPVCSAATETPICAAKTYSLCSEYGDPDLCSKVGNSDFAVGRTISENLPPLEGEPWRLTWQQIAERKKLCGMYVAADRDVNSDRFSAIPPIRGSMKGTHEVVLIHDATCLKVGGYDVQSLFMRQTMQGWEIVSFDDWSVPNPSDPTSIQGAVCLSSKHSVGNGYCISFQAGRIAPYRPEEILSERWRLTGPAEARLPSDTSNPVWAIDISDTAGAALGNIVFELTSEPADTCISGTWMKARLRSSTFKSYPLEQWYEGDFFPAYKISAGKENGKAEIALQLNAAICDAYLFLTGEYSGRDGKGDFYSFGLGNSQELGTFIATRK